MILLYNYDFSFVLELAKLQLFYEKTKYSSKIHERMAIYFSEPFFFCIFAATLAQTNIL